MNYQLRMQKNHAGSTARSVQETKMNSAKVISKLSQQC